MNITDPLDKQNNLDDSTENESPKLPRVNDCFFGLYIDFMPEDSNAQKFLANSASYIGLELCLQEIDATSGSAGDADAGSGSDNDAGAGADANSSSKNNLWIAAKNGNAIAKVPNKYAKELYAALSEGWNITALISMVTYSKKEGKFFVEAAFMGISPNCDEPLCNALQKFESHQIKRIKGGDHPTIGLSQSQFEKVIETGGEWYMTKIAKLTDDQKKRMSYKKSQSLTGKMVDMSQNHQRGCAFASTIILLAMAALIVWAIFRLFVH